MAIKQIKQLHHGIRLNFPSIAFLVASLRNLCLDFLLFFFPHTSSSTLEEIFFSYKYKFSFVNKSRELNDYDKFLQFQRLCLTGMLKFKETKFGVEILKYILDKKEVFLEPSSAQISTTVHKF